MCLGTYLKKNPVEFKGCSFKYIFLGYESALSLYFDPASLREVFWMFLFYTLSFIMRQPQETQRVCLHG